MDFSKLTAYLNSLDQRYGVHGLDCKIMRGHEPLYRHMAGHSDYAQTKPVTRDDLYDVYSCTKIVTMTAVMQLVEQGKLGLEDELTQYLPEFAEMRVAKDFPIGEWPFTWPTQSSPTETGKAADFDSSTHVHDGGAVLRCVFRADQRDAARNRRQSDHT